MYLIRFAVVSIYESTQPKKPLIKGMILVLIKMKTKLSVKNNIIYLQDVYTTINKVIFSEAYPSYSESYYPKFLLF